MKLAAFWKKSTILGVGAVVTLTSFPAYAVIEEINITARRRAETLYESPSTVTAVSQDDLRKARLDDITSIIELIPNSNVPDSPQSFTTFINIRGIRQPDPQVESAFGLYRNGIYFGGHRPNLGAQVDVERVEVLRGPQGGLFGRNAVGGAVNIVYAMPTNEYEGYGRFSYSRYQRSEIEGMINVPVADRLGLRLAAWAYDQTKGEFYNSYLNEELDESQDLGVRLSSRIDIADNVQLKLVGEYQEVEGPSNRAFSPNGVIQTLSGLVGPAETPRSIQHDTLNDAQFDQLYVTADLEVDTRIGTFNVLASYRDYTYQSIEDQDFSIFQPTDAPFALKQEFMRNETIDNVYYELLWTSPQDQALTWIAGVSYFSEEFNFYRNFKSFLDFDQLGFLLLPPIGVRSAYGAIPGPTLIGTDSVSVFGELTWDVTDRLSLIASARWNRDDKALNYSQYIWSDDPVSLPLFQILFAGAVPTFALQSNPDYENFSPGGGIRFDLNDNVNLYAVINTGFRAGSFNTTTTNPAFIPYGPEESINFEVGAKTRLLDGRMTANFAIFNMKQDDLLLQRDDPADTLFFFTFLDNAGEGDTWGVEVELQNELTDYLTASLSLGWLNAEISDGFFESTSGAITQLSGKKIPYTRDYTINARLDLQYPLPNLESDLVGYVNARIEDGGYLDAVNTVDYDGQEIIDIALGLQKDNWRLVAFVDNVLDDKIKTFEFAVGAETLTKGQTYGIDFSINF